MKQSWAFFPVALAAALAVAGCGTGLGKTSSPPARPAAEVLAKEMSAAIKKASSVHISGTVTSSGDTVVLDVGLTRSGDSAGSMSMDKASVSVLGTGGHTYIVLTSGFMKAEKMSSATCSLMCGKYLELSPSDAKSMLGGSTMHDFVDQPIGAGPFRYGGSATIDGQPAWLIHNPDGSTVYVSAQGSHYPLRVIVPSGSDKGQLDFTQWGSVKIPPAPPASKVVNLSQLEGS
jgi:hypothetical protein